MAANLRYQWHCAVHAATETFDRANSWAWLTGYAALWLVLTSLGYTMMEPNGPGGILLIGGLSLGTAWLLIFVWRFVFISPHHLHLAAQIKIKALETEISELRGRTALAITFDPSNPHDRFWERMSPRDESGNPLPGMMTEYRVRVENISAKTVRNVRISRESFGIKPQLAAGLIFSKDGKENRDLQPGCHEFIAVLWKHPPREGDLWGESATAYHGPIKITASGDDVLPDSCMFDYRPDEIPVLVQRSD